MIKCAPWQGSQPYRQYSWSSWGVALLLEGKSWVCVRCNCMQNTGKEALHWILTTSAERLPLSRWKVRCTAASSSHICPPEVGCLIDIWKPSIISPYKEYCIITVSKLQSHTFLLGRWWTVIFTGRFSQLCSSCSERSWYMKRERPKNTG